MGWVEFVLCCLFVGVWLGMLSVSCLCVLVCVWMDVSV